MSVWRALALGLLGFGTSGCGASVVTAPVNGPTADAPTYFVHDTWLMSNGSIARVVQIEQDGGTIFSGGLGFVRCGFSCTYRWRLGTVEEAWQATPPQPRVLVLMGQGWKLFDFPLAVGKTWHSSGPGTVRETTMHITLTGRVWSYGSVRTKAGTFMAFRLTYEWGRINPDYVSNYTQVVWYAPSVKFPVKEESYGSSWELIAYGIK